MLSFHNDPTIKAKYIARVQAHAEAYELVQDQGIGWCRSSGKGCAIGCTLNAYEHARYPIELGIPAWAASLEDCIFEGLPNELAMTWPIRFLQAIPVGMNDEQWREVFWAIGEKRLTRLRDDQRASIGNKWGVVAAIEGVLNLYATRSAAISATYKAEDPERSAARSAAYQAANSAANSAADSADSADAADSAARSSAMISAISAADSTDLAAYQAEISAAYVTALVTEYIDESEWLLEAIKGRTMTLAAA